VAYLQPFMEAEKAQGDVQARGRVLVATVKGDVHDIGKNIVSVVLGCNNYQVIDLGVMVPCEKILDAAVREKVDIVGLSGLITPSLDEMVHVAQEMERRGLSQPLLIGGATTNREHTAVKIAPQRSGPTVHVLDASRAVGVVSALLDAAQKDAFDRKTRAEQEQLRAIHADKQRRPLVPYAAASAGQPAIVWRAEDVPAPAFIGRRAVERQPLDELARFIDWTFFFTAWELKGKYPQILEHPKYGAAARDLFGAAQKLLAQIVEEKSLTACAAYGFWPACSEDSTIVLFSDESRTRELCRFPMLRQQSGSGPYYCLADFVAPASAGLADHVGAFAVTAGLGAQDLVKRFEQARDDYSAIMVKALADRLAEAFAECLHQRVRREWGYGADENLSNQDLIAEKYRGIRPAVGYPAWPDHTEKQPLFDLLRAPEVGITLTESSAMSPAASVCGLYLAHPLSRYFDVGRIDRVQTRDYARRRGLGLEEMERWLAPNLGYDRGVERV
jgi:5-methyltetrahydrofolate--homocysteine methyltransferase